MRPALFRLAEQQLLTVGDATLGEWREPGSGPVVHLRRRLTAEEQDRGGIAAVVDVRGSLEGARRMQAMRPFLPAAMQAIPSHLLP